MSPGQPLLQLEGISKHFGPVRALDRVDFAVNAGEVVGLVGDNGEEGVKQETKQNENWNKF